MLHLWWHSPAMRLASKLCNGALICCDCTLIVHAFARFAQACIQSLCTLPLVVAKQINTLTLGTFAGGCMATTAAQFAVNPQLLLGLTPTSLHVPAPPMPTSISTGTMLCMQQRSCSVWGAYKSTIPVLSLDMCLSAGFSSCKCHASQISLGAVVAQSVALCATHTQLRRCCY